MAGGIPAGHEGPHAASTPVKLVGLPAVIQEQLLQPLHATTRKLHLTASTSWPRSGGTAGRPNAASARTGAGVPPQAHAAAGEPEAGRVASKPSGPVPGNTQPSPISRSYQRLHGGPPFDVVREPSRASRLLRIIFIIGIFAAGAAVGLTAAWWMGLPASMQNGQHGMQAQMPEAGQHDAAAAMGIRPSELPYDGIPRDTTSDQGVAVAEPGGREVQPAGASSANSATAGTTAPVVPRAASTSGARSGPERGAAPDTKKRQPAGGAKGRTAKPAATSRTVKDREIERIKQQAEDELKKKIEYGVAAGAAVSGRAAVRRITYLLARGSRAAGHAARMRAHVRPYSSESTRVAGAQRNG